MRKELNTTMDISMYRIETTPERVNEFRGGRAYIDLNEEELLLENEAKELYNELLKEHYEDYPDDHDYTFNDFRYENDILNVKDLMYGFYFGWTTYPLPEGKILLVVAIHNE